MYMTFGEPPALAYHNEIQRSAPSEGHAPRRIRGARAGHGRPMPVIRWLQAPTSALALLVARTHAQQALLLRVRACLPAPLQAHCLGAVERNDRLTLFAANAAWAMRLRYETRDVGHCLRRIGIDYRGGITTRVLAPTTTFDHRRQHAVYASKGSAPEAIRGAAERVIDPPLREALRRLAARCAAVADSSRDRLECGP